MYTWKVLLVKIKSYPKVISHWWPSYAHQISPWSWNIQGVAFFSSVAIYCEWKGCRRLFHHHNWLPPLPLGVAGLLHQSAWQEWSVSEMGRISYWLIEVIIWRQSCMHNGNLLWCICHLIWSNLQMVNLVPCWGWHHGNMWLLKYIALLYVGLRWCKPQSFGGHFENFDI